MAVDVDRARARTRAVVRAMARAVVAVVVVRALSSQKRTDCNDGNPALPEGDDGRKKVSVKPAWHTG